MAEVRPRLWTLPAAILAGAGACLAIYHQAPRAVAEVAILPYAAALVGAPALLYPWLRRRGARPGLAAAGALCVYAAWLVKEGVRIQALFGLGGALYYALNPLSMGIALLLTTQMAVAELVLRRLHHGRWVPGGGPARALAAVAGVGGAMAAVGLSSDPSVLFYTYVAGYELLLGE